MSRTATLMAALGEEPVTTSDLYDRIGYLELTRLGLIPYHAFRAELDRLAAAGLAVSSSAEDGSSLWRCAERVSPPAGPPRGQRADPAPHRHG